MNEIPNEFPLPQGAFERQRSLLTEHVLAGRSASRLTRRQVLVVTTAVLGMAVAATSAFGVIRHFFAPGGPSAWYSTPSWSPDGGRIAYGVYQWSGDRVTPHGPMQLYVMNADGSGQRNLTREWGIKGAVLGTASFPVWSPDWRKVAFAQERSTRVTHEGRVRHSDLYVINADGSRMRRLTRSPQNDGDPVWSPNGRKLAFVRILRGNADIYLISVDGTGLRRLAHAISFKPDPRAPSPGFFANPVWSPDGHKLAFVSNRDGNRDVYVVNEDGSGLRNLTRGRGDDGKPVWSPDGQRIAFRSDRDGNGEVYVASADGSGLKRLTRSPASDGGAVWSPDGHKLLFVRFNNGNSDIYVTNADGTRQRNLTPEASPPRRARDSSPEWSPDGRRIVFVSQRSGTGEVYVMNADGGGKRNLSQLRRAK